MQIDFDAPLPEGVRLKSEAEVILKLRYIKEHLKYQQVFNHYNLRWLSSDTHQLSCVFHASNRDAQGRPFERHPSARYYAQDKQIWCFACAEGGDVSWFIKKKEDHSYYGETIDYVKTTFGIYLTDTDLGQRIAQYNKSQEPAELGRRQLVGELFLEKVNDEFYKLRKMGKNDPNSPFCQIADRLEAEVFARKAELDLGEGSYLEYSRQLRRWNDWTQELIVAALKFAAKK